MGQKLMVLTASIEPIDARSFALKLKEPYGLVLGIDRQAVVLNTRFMMPKRLRKRRRASRSRSRSDPVLQIRAGGIPAGLKRV